MTAPARSVDQCGVCGRFVGRYPVGFSCDTHCSRCVCTRCPGFRDEPSAHYAVELENRRMRAIEREARELRSAA